MENDMFWSEIGSGFGEPSGTPPSRISMIIRWKLGKPRFDIVWWDTLNTRMKAIEQYFTMALLRYSVSYMPTLPDYPRVSQIEGESPEHRLLSFSLL